MVKCGMSKIECLRCVLKFFIIIVILNGLFNKIYWYVMELIEYILFLFLVN